jgi:quercetin dioxygenase-like cupin family protein
MTGTPTAGILRQFNEAGFLGPVRLLTRRECRSLMSYLDSRDRPTAAEWPKGAAVTDWLLYRLAANPRLLELVKLILGEDVVLWGCSIVRRGPKEVHPWHVDIETSAPDGRCISVWIGLENTKRNGALELIAGSHAVDKVVQQIQWERGYRRGEPTTEAVLGWARERNGAAALAKPQVDDGDALLFDGRLWHGSRNLRRSGTRTALLLQFASADTPISMHDETALEWPFPPALKPPVIVLHGGVTDEDTNRLVRPPSRAEGSAMLSTCVIPLDLPLEEQPGGGWKSYQLFGGATPVVDHMNCHASVLSAGESPHQPHGHREEELLIVLDGEAELLTADRPSADGARVERAGPGAIAYYPAFQNHGIRNPGPGPVTYVMFKWRVNGAKAPSDQILANLFRCPDARSNEVDGWVTQRVMEGPTGWLGQLHCHVSDLAPGAGYEPHVDAYDVAIVTLSGEIETLGREVVPHGVIYYAAGEKHGMRNIGDKPARYLVFEFHPSAIDVGQRLKRKFPFAAKQMLKRAALAMGVDLRQLRERLGSRI